MIFFNKVEESPIFQHSIIPLFQLRSEAELSSGVDLIKINRIEKDGILFAVYLRSGDWEEGLNFISQDEDSIQVGLWNYQAGKLLGPHRHVINNRKISRTQEVIFIKKGSLRAVVYEEEDQPVKSVRLRSGDFLVTFFGGHGYEILEDGTQVLEVKNGPFTGLQDRIPIDKTI